MAQRVDPNELHPALQLPLEADNKLRTQGIADGRKRIEALNTAGDAAQRFKGDPFSVAVMCIPRLLAYLEWYQEGQRQAWGHPPALDHLGNRFVESQSTAISFAAQFLVGAAYVTPFFQMEFAMEVDGVRYRPIDNKPSVASRSKDRWLPYPDDDIAAAFAHSLGRTFEEPQIKRWSDGLVQAGVSFDLFNGDGSPRIGRQSKFVVLEIQYIGHIYRATYDLARLAKIGE